MPELLDTLASQHLFHAVAVCLKSGTPPALPGVLAGWRLGQLVQAWQVRDRLQDLARQEPGLGISQLPQAAAQGGQLSAVDAAGRRGPGRRRRSWGYSCFVLL